MMRFLRLKRLVFLSDYGKSEAALYAGLSKRLFLRLKTTM